MQLRDVGNTDVFLKYLIIFLVLVFGNVVAFAAMNYYKLMPRQKAPITAVSTESQKKPANVTPAVLTSEEKISFYNAKPVISLDGKFVADLSAIKFDDGWKVALRFFPYDGESRVSIEPVIWRIPDRETVKMMINQFVGKWSRDNRSLAIYVNGELLYWGLDVVGVEIEAHKFERRAVLGDVISSDKYYRVYDVLFIDGGQRVAIISTADLREVYPSEKVIEKGWKDFFALPNEDGYGHVNPPLRGESTSYTMVMVRSGVKTEYPLTVSAQMDGAGPVILSPGNKNVCVEYGASGYHGYAISRFGETEPIATGQQYSWCGYWIDEYRVVVKEKPYHLQTWTSYYILDARTGRKTLVGTFESEK